MIGESEKKVDILMRLGCFTNKPQLNKAFVYASYNDDNFCPILVKCGADPGQSGLSNKQSKKPTDVIEGRWTPQMKQSLLVFQLHGTSVTK
jgi:hypothetical protein